MYKESKPSGSNLELIFIYSNRKLFWVIVTLPFPAASLVQGRDIIYLNKGGWSIWSAVEITETRQLHDLYTPAWTVNNSHLWEFIV